MSALRREFGRLGLQQKFTLVIIGVVLVPAAVLILLLFGNMQSVLLQDRVADLEASLLNTRADLEKAAELCNLTTLYFEDNAGLCVFLDRAARDEQVPPQELIDFYREDIGTLERFVTANPYLYQVRVYQPNADLPEIMPILYHQDRMQRLGWEQNWSSGQWQLDYDDTIFSPVAAQPTRHIMSVVTALEDRELGSLGVLEVAVRMDEVLPGLYDSTGNCALLVGGSYYTGDHAAGLWEEHLEELGAVLDPHETGVQTAELLLGGERALVASVLMEPLGGYYQRVLFHADIAPGLAASSRMFFGLTLSLLLLLVVCINLLVKAMLRRFYLVVDAVAQVRDGNLSVQIPDVGHDEVGALGEQVGSMLDRIQSLMQENVDRQLLAKNAEIKALQSQINNHFIYNVLESIKMLAEVDERYDIADALGSLGRMLRYSMRWTSQSVSLAEELEHIEHYLALINLRFDYRTSLVLDVPERLLAQRVPKMILQPIVENAVVHGIEELAEDTRLAIRVLEPEATDQVRIEVTDHGKGIDPERLEAINRRLRDGVDTALNAPGGIGLKNVHDRIVMACGPEYGLRVESEEGRFTRVVITIPREEGAPGADQHCAGG